MSGKGFAYLFEMGCGKTLTAIATVGQLYVQRLARRVLIVAPLSVVPVWPKEFDSYAAFDYTCVPLEGTKTKRLKLLDGLQDSPGLQVACVNYDMVKSLYDELAAFDADIIIADESQKIKTATSARSKAMHKLGAKSRYNLLLTGTPISNGPLDIFSQYKFMDPDIIGIDSWYAFQARHAIMGEGVNPQTGGKFRTVIGYKNLSELLEKVHSAAYRVTKDNALDLPERIYQTRYCDLEPEARRVYNSMEKDSIAKLTDVGPAISTRHIITRLLRLSQIAGGFVRLDVDGYEDDPDAGKYKEISKAKSKALEDLVDDLVEAGKKFVIFARFKLEIAEIEKVLTKKLGPDAWRKIDGSVPGKDRGQMVDDFQEDNGVRAFIAQIQSASAGITLTAADTAIFYSFDYSYMNYEQALARIHRVGQTRACTYIHIIARNTIDDVILSALQHKRDIADICVDNWRDVVEGKYNGEKQ